MVDPFIDRISGDDETVEFCLGESGDCEVLEVRVDMHSWTLGVTFVDQFPW